MRVLSAFILFLMLSTAYTATVEAQFRDQSDSRPDFTGAVTDAESESFFDGITMQMNHSYEMTAGSIGGQGYTQNFYTNTMQFLFSENLRGRLDMSVGHSPFGNNFAGEQGAQFFIRNAMLQYDVSDNTSITFQFRQIPAGMYGGGYGYGGYGMNSAFERSRSPFNSGSALHGW